jgi:hypothetical protein
VGAFSTVLVCVILTNFAFTGLNVITVVPPSPWPLATWVHALPSVETSTV